MLKIYALKNILSLHTRERINTHLRANTTNHEGNKGPRVIRNLWIVRENSEVLNSNRLALGQGQDNVRSHKLP